MHHLFSKTSYENMYFIRKSFIAIVAEVLSSNPLNVSFRRTLVGDKLTEWYSLVASLVHINLYEEMVFYMEST